LASFEIIRDPKRTLIRWSDQAIFSLGVSAIDNGVGKKDQGVLPHLPWRLCNRQGGWERRPGRLDETVACERQVQTLLWRDAGQEVLHGAAIRTHVGTIGVCGPSGAGKSTLAAALGLGGRQIVADDEIVIREKDGCLWLMPAYSGSRLTRRSMELLRLSPGQFGADFPGSDKTLWKESKAVADVNGYGEQKLRAIVILEIRNDEAVSANRFQRVEGAAAFQALWQQLKFPWMSLPEWRPRQFNLIGRLVREVPVFCWKQRLAKCSPFERASELVERLETAMPPSDF
jgi:hypothetical protein